jgi:hypothetical protein
MRVLLMKLLQVGPSLWNCIFNCPMCMIAHVESNQNIKQYLDASIS